MNKYAIIKNNIVENVIEYESDPAFPIDGFSEEYIAIICDYCSPNWTYRNGIFIAPQPYLSWNLVNGKWVAPIPYPNDNNLYFWNEELKQWV